MSDPQANFLPLIFFLSPVHYIESVGASSLSNRRAGGECMSVTYFLAWSARGGNRPNTNCYRQQGEEKTKMDLPRRRLTGQFCPQQWDEESVPPFLPPAQTHNHLFFSAKTLAVKNGAICVNIERATTVGRSERVRACVR